MRKSPSYYLRLVFLLGDIVILNLALVLAFVLLPVADEATPLKDLIFLVAASNSLWLVLSLLINPYKFSRITRFVRILRVHFSFILTHCLAVVSVVFVSGISTIKISNLFSAFVVSLLLLFVWRAFYFYLNRIFINKQLNFRNVVIVGYGELALEMRKFFRLHPEYGYRFLGYFDRTEKKGRDINRLDDLENFCNDNNVHELYCCLPYLDNSKVKYLVDYGLSNLIKVKLITDYRGFFSRGISLQTYDRIPVLNIAAIPLDERVNSIIKRAFDIIFSLFVITFFLSWAFPLIAILIKLDSRGPIFFRQKRTGKDNRDFWCLKFRTMYVNNHADTLQATKNDDRITAVGSILRKTSLDEFPQFFNVLMGSMSVVGPRPHMLKHTEQYSKLITKFMARHNVKPGITGLAQSMGFRGETRNLIEMKHRVKLDRFYIHNWSFPLDIKIIISTMISLIRGNSQAY
jgi:putative colanic acid biosysnthesis UDP-glucose lipid carrier transferase